MIKATTKLGSCQVRSDTGRPCPRRAVVEIRGVPFCERCAREQEAYFAIGELTQEEEEEARGLRDESLLETLGRMQWERTYNTPLRDGDGEGESNDRGSSRVDGRAKPSRR